MAALVSTTIQACEFYWPSTSSALFAGSNRKMTHMPAEMRNTLKMFQATNIGSPAMNGKARLHIMPPRNTKATMRTGIAYRILEARIGFNYIADWLGICQNPTKTAIGFAQTAQKIASFRTLENNKGRDGHPAFRWPSQLGRLSDREGAGRG